jgi:pimeloyl-ACP methyl ester carboxylesterase
VGWGLTDEPLVLARDRSMFVGGQYAQSVDGLVIDGAMYVHERVPAKQTHPYPIVMIHGVNGTGAYFEGTPDGREGWAQLFVRAGFAVYVVDQPARGRSPYFPDLHGPMPASSVFGAQALAELYTAPAVYDTYPQAKLHTQWPSDHANAGRPGDPVFDRSLAGQVKSLPTATGTPERLIKAAGGALLDRIGPAILLTHSQGGAFGWQIADARPGAVKAIVTIEPALTPAHPQGGSATPAYGRDRAPRDPRRFSRRLGVLGAGGARTAPAHARRNPDRDHHRRGVTARAAFALHLALPHASRRRQRSHPPRERRDPRQQSQNDDRKKQRRDRHVHPDVARRSRPLTFDAWKGPGKQTDRR